VFVPRAYSRTQAIDFGQAVQTAEDEESGARGHGDQGEGPENHREEPHALALGFVFETCDGAVRARERGCSVYKLESGREHRRGAEVAARNGGVSKFMNL
jgi:hypothetical protein